MSSGQYFNYNNTSPLGPTWYAPDLDGSRFRTTRHFLQVTCAVSVAVGATLFILISLKLWEDRHTFRVRDPTNEDRAWVVAFFHSNLAAPSVIWMNVLMWTSSSSTMFVDYADAPTCITKQKYASGFYAASLAATYTLFEIRRMSTGVKLTGMKQMLATLVKLGTCSMPIFAPIAALAASGYYIEELNSCSLSVQPTVTILFVLGDSALSIGHLLVFIFALQRHTQVKIVPARQSQKVLPTVPSNGSHRLLTANSEVALQASLEAQHKIQAIARRNFWLALVSTISTFASVGITALVNVTAPALGSHGVETSLYLREVSQIILTFDLPINSITCLCMTPQWQPKVFKQAVAVSRQSRGTRVQVPENEESDVSTLGGTS